VRLLLHICCGPCASGTIQSWRRKGVDVVALFHNPNIHPLLEYRRRLTGAREVTEILRTELVVDDAYDPEVWFHSVACGADETRSRCARCIGLRLERAAQEAVALGFDAFSTSLSVSPWQDHEAIQAEGLRVQEAAGVEFLYDDLRPEYGESRRFSKEHGIYRQKYCGCLVSEWERYRDR